LKSLSSIDRSSRETALARAGSTLYHKFGVYQTESALFPT